MVTDFLDSSSMRWAVSIADLDLFAGTEGFKDWLSKDYDDPVSTLIDIDIDESVGYQDELGEMGTPHSEYTIIDSFRRDSLETELALQFGNVDPHDNLSAARHSSCDSEVGESLRVENEFADGTATSPAKPEGKLGKRKRISPSVKYADLGTLMYHNEPAKTNHANASHTYVEGKAEPTDYNSTDERKDFEGSSGETSMVDVRRLARQFSEETSKENHTLEQDRAKFKPHSIKACIFQVLEEAGPAGLQVAQIVDITQERGMKDWRGVLTPKCTVSASCSTDSVFVRVAPGTFALRALLDDECIPVTPTRRKRKRHRICYNSYR